LEQVFIVLEDLFSWLPTFDVEDQIGLVESHSMLASELIGHGTRGGVSDACDIVPNGALRCVFGILDCLSARFEECFAQDAGTSDED